MGDLFIGCLSTGDFIWSKLKDLQYGIRSKLGVYFSLLYCIFYSCMQIFMMNLSTTFICEFSKDIWTTFLEMRLKQEHFLKLKAGSFEDFSLAKSIIKHKRITVITQGADPVCVVESGKMKLYLVILLPKDKLVDTNGAVYNNNLIIFKINFKWPKIIIL
ncbi:hypothetical protein JHK85_023288 [Glycine max]|uniref:Adenosine kinase n=1 Tax=Glycine max TaxID=3847 RepID=A0A0R0IWX0_SOYBN|nr:hypothetical protein JHK87_022699 [Glycine soja]KAG5017152.1 hypothetical protein JHK85_023288 [Glycine max]KAG5026907.1 hypothetical protein JHK86_022821 [Glycine max]